MMMIVVALAFVGGEKEVEGQAMEDFLSTH